MSVSKFSRRRYLAREFCTCSSGGSGDRVALRKMPSKRTRKSPLNLMGPIFRVWPSSLVRRCSTVGVCCGSAVIDGDRWYLSFFGAYCCGGRLGGAESFSSSAWMVCCCSSSVFCNWSNLLFCRSSSLSRRRTRSATFVSDGDSQAVCRGFIQILSSGVYQAE